MPSVPGYIANPDLAFGYTSDPGASSSLQGADPRGMYVPEGWGHLWRAALAQAPFRNVIVSNWSASIWNGFYSSSWQRTPTAAPTGVEGLVMDALQQRYGDGGSGFFSVRSINGVVTGSASSASASGAGGNFVGGWDNLGAGINGFGIFPHVAGSGVTITDTNVRGTNIDIYWFPTVSASQVLSVSIDGVAQTTISTTVGTVTGMGKTTYAVAAGTHTLVITATTGVPIVMGWTGRNDTGILPIRLGSAGRVTQEINTNATGIAGETEGKQSIQGMTLQAGGTNLWGSGKTGENSGPDLLIVGDMMVNDITSFIEPNTVASALAEIFRYAKAGNPGCEIVMTNPNLGNFADSRTRTTSADGTQTSGSNLITSSSAGFNPTDIGAAITGTGIPASTIIMGVNPSAINQAALSKNATSTISGTATFTIIRQGPLYIRYLAYSRTVAEQFGAAWINFWPMSNNNYSNWDTTHLGYWGDGTNDGKAGADGIHLSDAGHAFEAGVVIPLIVGRP